jgi:hypothetical protein
MSRHDDAIETTSMRLTRIEKYLKERFDFLRRQNPGDMTRLDDNEFQLLRDVMFPKADWGKRK